MLELFKKILLKLSVVQQQQKSAKKTSAKFLKKMSTKMSAKHPQNHFVDDCSNRKKFEIIISHFCTYQGLALFFLLYPSYFVVLR